MEIIRIYGGEATKFNVMNTRMCYDLLKCFDMSSCTRRNAVSSCVYYISPVSLRITGVVVNNKNQHKTMQIIKTNAFFQN